MNIYLRKLQKQTLDNKYTKWYINIVRDALKRINIDVYTENHHILPKCFKLGGEKDKRNIVILTAREHFVCHQLLVRMTDDKVLKLKLSCAALRMAFSNGVDRYKISSIVFSQIKEQLSRNKLGSIGYKWTDEQREKLKNRPHGFTKGMTHTEETKLKIKEKRKLQIMSPRSPETKEKLRRALIGKSRSKETKIKIRLKSSKNKVMWNNRIISKYFIESPGEGWIKGRLR